MLLVDIGFCTPEDLDDLVQIEEESFCAPWTKALLAADLGGGRDAGLLYIGARRGRLLGYMAGRVQGDAFHVFRFGILASWRRRGVGSQLLIAAEQVALSLGCAALSLEVRESNREALALYDRFCFVLQRRLPGYYTDTGEDALLLRSSVPFLLSEQ